MSATILPFNNPLEDAVISLHSYVPETAMTAELLGTERLSHAIQVSDDGLMLTAGYSVLEATDIVLTNSHGQTTSGILLAQDFDSGIALVKPASSLGRSFLPTASLDSLRVGGRARVLTSDANPLDVRVIAVDEFAGRWEYLLEEAIYTMPLCEHWSGAGLLNQDNQLVGIGSLALGLAEDGGEAQPGNLFIPVELIMPHLEYLTLHGESPGQKRPWLGMLAEEVNTELHVVGIYHDAPAAEAGIKPGDVILSVGSQPVASLPGFFRTLWHYGPAGSDIPLVLKADEGRREVVLKTTDRNSFFARQETTTLN
jgi:S1-C subfamily serine protease